MIRVRMAPVVESKCSRCQWGTVSHDKHGHLVQSVCALSEQGRELTRREPVVECTSFQFRFEREMHHISERAWILEVKKGRVIGFKSPDERKD